MEGYSVKIQNASKNLSAKERVAIKDTTNAIPLDEATQQGKVVIEPDFYVELSVHNEKSEDKDYTKFVVVDKSGNKYVTGSESFITAFKDILDEMADSEEEEEFGVEVYRMPSKNYKGKEFLTCSIV